MSLIDETTHQEIVNQLDQVDKDITYLWVTRSSVMGETGKAVVKILDKLNGAVQKLLVEMDSASPLYSLASDDRIYPVAMPSPLYQALEPHLGPETRSLIHSAGLGHMILDRD